MGKRTVGCFGPLAAWLYNILLFVVAYATIIEVLVKSLFAEFTETVFAEDFSRHFSIEVSYKVERTINGNSIE